MRSINKCSVPLIFFLLVKMANRDWLDWSSSWNVIKSQIINDVNCFSNINYYWINVGFLANMTKFSGAKGENKRWYPITDFYVDRHMGSRKAILCGNERENHEIIENFYGCTFWQ